jgi:hypothetical protein
MLRRERRRTPTSLWTDLVEIVSTPKTVGDVGNQNPAKLQEPGAPARLRFALREDGEHSSDAIGWWRRARAARGGSRARLDARKGSTATGRPDQEEERGSIEPEKTDAAGERRARHT